jgi:hypothetical protein
MHFSARKKTRRLARQRAELENILIGILRVVLKYLKFCNGQSNSKFIHSFLFTQSLFALFRKYLEQYISVRWEQTQNLSLNLSMHNERRSERHKEKLEKGKRMFILNSREEGIKRN